jgi:hypothetical protein
MTAAAVTRKPLFWPRWLMLATGIAVSVAIYLPLRTYWGLTAYGPWLATLGASAWQARRRS